jgi:Ankyrin repeats (3 copies)
VAYLRSKHADSTNSRELIAKMQQFKQGVLNACLFSVARSGSVQMTRQLMAPNGVFVPYVNCTDGLMRTPLFTAIQHGHRNVVSALIEYRADVEYPDCYGVSPLALAAFLGDTKTCRLLLKSGANFTTRDRAGLIPLQYAIYSGQLKVVALLSSKMALRSSAPIKTNMVLVAQAKEDAAKAKRKKAQLPLAQTWKAVFAAKKTAEKLGGPELAAMLKRASTARAKARLSQSKAVGAEVFPLDDVPAARGRLSSAAGDNGPAKIELVVEGEPKAGPPDKSDLVVPFATKLIPKKQVDAGDMKLESMTTEETKSSLTNATATPKVPDNAALIASVRSPAEVDPFLESTHTGSEHNTPLLNRKRSGPRVIGGMGEGELTGVGDMVPSAGRPTTATGSSLARVRNLSQTVDGNYVVADIPAPKTAPMKSFDLSTPLIKAQPAPSSPQIVGTDEFGLPLFATSSKKDIPEPVAAAGGTKLNLMGGISKLVQRRQGPLKAVVCCVLMCMWLMWTCGDADLFSCGAGGAAECGRAGEGKREGGHGAVLEDAVQDTDKDTHSNTPTIQHVSAQQDTSRRAEAERECDIAFVEARGL